MKILYEDNFLVAVDKPSGMLVIPDRWRKEVGKTLIDLLTKKYSMKIYVVHRLDRDTSGVVLFAKSAEAHRGLSKIFEERKMEKTYNGLVHGDFPKDEMVMHKPLAICRRNPALMIVDQKGKPSQTQVKVLDRLSSYSWLEIIPLTGRTHQIRVHLASIGFPLVCDRLYGFSGDEIFLSHFKRKYKAKGPEKPLLSRLALHAAKLSFDHPLLKKEVEIVSPLPKDLKAAYQQLKNSVKFLGNSKV